MRPAILILIGILAGAGAASYGTSSTQAQGSSAKLNVVVVCTKCIPEDMPQEAYNTGDILLDQNTGKLWFYPGLIPGAKPRLLGTLLEAGQPISKPPTP